MTRLLASAVLAAAVLSATPAAHSEGRQTGGRLIVLKKEDATLVTVDPSTGKVLGRVPTGEGPHEVAVSADGATAFVGNYGAQTPGSRPGALAGSGFIVRVSSSSAV